ncbi:MAG: hypothetical protein NXI21_05480 [Alphaproteobacteria bacterium]|nr:hypothetical protein [Alphaproteobacteria bacterium]
MTADPPDDADPRDAPLDMVRGVRVPGRIPRTHAPEGWPGPVDLALDPGRGRRNGVTLLVAGALGVAAYVAVGGGAVLGWALAVLLLALAAGSIVRVQGEPSALRLTREGIEFVGARPPRRLKWTDVTAVDLVDMPRGLSLRPGGPEHRVIRLSSTPGRPPAPPVHDVMPTGPAVDLEGLAWALEGWRRYANRPW